MTALVVIIVLVALMVLFSVQNAMPVAISFLFWRFEASLAIVVFLSVVTGVAITAIVLYSGRIRKLIQKGEKTPPAST